MRGILEKLRKKILVSFSTPNLKEDARVVFWNGYLAALMDYKKIDYNEHIFLKKYMEGIRDARALQAPD